MHVLVLENENKPSIILEYNIISGLSNQADMVTCWMTSQRRLNVMFGYNKDMMKLHPLL